MDPWLFIFFVSAAKFPLGPLWTLRFHSLVFRSLFDAGVTLNTGCHESLMGESIGTGDSRREVLGISKRM